MYETCGKTDIFFQKLKIKTSTSLGAPPRSYESFLEKGAEWNFEIKKKLPN